MRVLGIDPGLRITGFGCVRADDGYGRFRLIEAGAIRLRGGRSVAERLQELDADLAEAIVELKPDVVAVEKLFAHYRRPTTAVIMGHARGVILLAAQRAGVRLVEVGATEVKKSITGFGHASKSQMQEAVRTVLGLTEPPEPADVADALAIAMCASARLAAPSVG